VDHHTRALRVNGSSFVGQGWYVYGNAAMTIDELFAPVTRHAELGINMIMPYALGSFNATDQLRYLDRCHAVGVKVLYDMSSLGFSAQAGENYGKDWASTPWKRQVEGNVSLVASHPAVLAFYICDDCCPVDEHLGNVTLQAKLYNYIKELDPHHLVTGAVQCHNLWQWSDVPANPTYAPSAAEAATYRAGPTCLPVRGALPPLQLSLDLILVENYGGQLIDHAGDGTVNGGTSLDGSFRNGLAFAPIVNCHGLWANQPSGAGIFGDHPAAPKATRMCHGAYPLNCILQCTTITHRAHGLCWLLRMDTLCPSSCVGCHR
jgi:hypothetical protein